MPDRVFADLGADAPDVVYLCLPDRIVLIVNTHAAQAAG